jgi:hypothetical protein
LVLNCGASWISSTMEVGKGKIKDVAFPLLVAKYNLIW